MFIFYLTDGKHDFPLKRTNLFSLRIMVLDLSKSLWSPALLYIGFHIEFEKTRAKYFPSLEDPYLSGGESQWAGGH